MKVLILDPLKCTGCRACEYACSFQHTGVFNPLDSRIEVSAFLEDLSFVPTLCLQCEKAYCVEVCPTPALTKNDQTGVVDFNKDKCIGCKQCIVACPWGSIKLNCVGKEIIKCDNCDGDPACVKVCSAKALTFEEVEDVVLAKQKGTAARLKEIGKDLAKGVSS
ncbi:MAG: 4Fe-4S dicluster domain-containing protein [Candidatus Caldatribacteriota bacterium]|nr:4Fe-4S dicluster domain-containing protein [Candidatus Caldatribacteriota bacterium]